MTRDKACWDGSDEIRVCAWDIQLICSEYWFKHNLGKIKIFVYLHLAHWLIVCNKNWKYESPVVMKEVFFELDLQLIAIEGSLCTWVWRSENVSVSRNEIQPTCVVYEHHTRLALSNVTRGYVTGS